MPLEVKFEIEKTELLLQQETVATLTVVNSTPDPVDVLDPQFNRDSPILKITSGRTSVQVLRRGERYPVWPKRRTLKPGEQLVHRFALMGLAHIHHPDTYTIEAIVPTGPMMLDMVSSAPVSIIVHPVTPKGIDTTFVQGGYAFVKYAASFDGSHDAKRIVRHYLGLHKNGGALHAEEVAAADSSARPVISAPANQSVSHSHWIGWKQENEFRFVHMGQDIGPAEVSRWKRPPEGAELVKPLSINISDDAAARAGGHALVRCPGGSGDVFQTVVLNPGAAAEPGATVNAGGPVTWAMAFERSNASRYVAFTRQTGAGSAASTELVLSAWAGGPVPAAPKSVAKIPGRILAGDVLIEEDDRLNVAVLAQVSTDEGHALTMHRFVLDTQEQVRQLEPLKVAWPHDKEVYGPMVRVGPECVPAAVLRDERNVAKLFDGKDVKAAPPMFALPGAPMDIGFLSPSEPVLIGGMTLLGIDVVTFDGKPLPHKCA